MTQEQLQQTIFDGLYVQTDSLDSSLSDSVFPIFEEEQIFLCRQMQPTIKQLRRDQANHLNMLDVGTGSGILAIFADRVFAQQSGILHSYTIRALDRSQRAVDLAQINCRMNGCQQVEVLPAQPYSECAVELHSQDLIVMNPPFNPTYPKFLGVSTTLNGYTGLRVFREWLQYLPKHLRSDGMVIGYQMSPVYKDKIVALEELRAALGAESSVRYCRSLPEDYDTFEFLSAIYQSCLAASTPEEHDELATWIERTARSAPKLALIYYEASRQRSGVQVIEEIESRWCHQASWGDRIRLHQTVVENQRKRLS